MKFLGYPKTDKQTCKKIVFLPKIPLSGDVPFQKKKLNWKVCVPPDPYIISTGSLNSQTCIHKQTIRLLDDLLLPTKNMNNIEHIP